MTFCSENSLSKYKVLASLILCIKSYLVQAKCGGPLLEPHYREGGDARKLQVQGFSSLQIEMERFPDVDCQSV